MAYRYDEDLIFLSKMTSKDLDDLVYILTYDKDGEKRLTEELTLNTKYQTYYPEHKKYVEEIVAEIQCFGANSFATFLRGGQGVLYKEVLIDVCKKLKVNFKESSSTAIIENNLLMKILEDTIENMTPEQIKELSESIGIQTSIEQAMTNKVMILAGFQAIFRAGGFKSYQITVIIVNAVLKVLIGRGLTVAGNIALTRTMAILTGPIGWVITGLWTLIDIAGPAYRVTMPAVINIAALRQKYYLEQNDNIKLS